MSVVLSSAVARFRAVIERRLGLNFEDDKRDYLAGILHTQLEKSGESDTVYLERLELGVESGAGSQDWKALARVLTVSETYFFRHFAQFQAFSDVALRDRMLAQRHNRRLSILSAGCASGEEAYSLAMMIREAAVDASWKVSIRAADINSAVVDRAVNARYSSWSLRETPPEMQRKWFRPQGRDYVLVDTIRTSVQFEERNLAEDDANFWCPGSYDIIFCRNMMMYFSTQNAHALVQRITQALAPGGYLFLGHAETLRGLSHDFHLCQTHGVFYYRRRTHAESVTSMEVVSTDSSSQPLHFPLTASNNDYWMDTIRRSAERIQALAELPATISEWATPSGKVQWDLRDAQHLLRQERFADALDVVSVLPEEAARDVEALLLKAVLYVHSGKMVEAEQVCQRLLDVDELNAGARYVLALCCEEAGDNRTAVNHNQTAAYLDPNFAMPRLQLGLLARRTGNLHCARRELEHALILLQREDVSRLLLFGGGFGRDALLALCRAELLACGGRA